MISDQYRRFIRHLLAAAAEKNLSYAAIAEIMNVTENTARNWLSMRTVMPGDAVLRAISHIMEGYQC